MKKFITVCLALLSIAASAQNNESEVKAFIDIVRASSSSPAKTANALDAINYAKIGIKSAFTASGTNTYTVTGNVGISSYVAGQLIPVTFTNANTSTTVTLNVNSVGATSIKDNAGADPGIGDIISGATYWLQHDGTNYRIVGSSAIGSSGGFEEPYRISLETVSTAGSTITMDMGDKKQRLFIGSAAFSSAKTLAMTNVDSAVAFTSFFEITNTAAVLTLPGDWVSGDPGLSGGDWTPPVTGKYEINGTWDGTEWSIKFINKTTYTASVYAGTYTPTLYNTANVAATTAYKCTYMRVYNTVTVSGRIDLDPTTTATLTRVGISLPVASNFTTANECAGTAAAHDVREAAAVRSDATNDRAELACTPTDVTNQEYYFTFTYEVL